MHNTKHHSYSKQKGSTFPRQVNIMTTRKRRSVLFVIFPFWEMNGPFAFHQEKNPAFSFKCGWASSCFLFKTKWVRFSLPSEHRNEDEEEERLFRLLVSFSKINAPLPSEPERPSSSNADRPLLACFSKQHGSALPRHVDIMTKTGRSVLLIFVENCKNISQF